MPDTLPQVPNQAFQKRSLPIQSKSYLLQHCMLRARWQQVSVNNLNIAVSHDQLFAHPSVQQASQFTYRASCNQDLADSVLR